MRKLISRSIIGLFAALISMHTSAGVDLSGRIDRIWLKGDGNLWIRMDNTAFDTYCKPGWYGFNLYIPTSSADYPFYYGLLATAMSQNAVVYIANISVFDGSGHCDLTKTGYGIVVYKP